MTNIEGPIHIVGIGGMHMSAIAQLLHEQGELVSGSDLEQSAITRNLTAMGVTVFGDHMPENLGNARCVIATAAVGNENPEIAEAYRRGLPVLERPAVIAELMKGKRVIAVAGSHGKTTTTSLIAFILSQAGLQPMYLIGGESRDLGGNASWGSGDICVVEADEYQRAFHAYEPDIAVITNVDPDHLDLYGTPAAYEEAFLTFAQRLKARGKLLAGTGNTGAARVAKAAQGNFTVETYGVEKSCTWQAAKLELNKSGASFTVVRNGSVLGEIALSIPGQYAVENTLAAAAVCTGEGIPFATIRKAAERFQGAKRRFEHLGEPGGVLIIDEYAHHPSEVRAVLTAARTRFPERRIIGIHQPHTYSRIAYLWKSWLSCWNGLDALVVLETYAARETPTSGRGAEDLAKNISGLTTSYAADFPTAVEQATTLAQPGDVIMLIGAGSVTEVGPLLLEKLS
ncbi:MAG: UDP-N-acetylmuramate--L-alanine ligase [Dehalococcoidia bacterium]|nr:UDP-N-acetylmuramate--L-alanine ligase [Dehalococcoidia bacterium]|tara:strand:- start:1095 stop:2462 length:1368 start_codon:yes stop_codon:yes gene_type:complete